MWLRSPTRAPSSLARSVLDSPPARLVLPERPSLVHEAWTDRDRSERLGTALCLHLRKLLDFSPTATDTVRRPFPALVLVHMIMPRSCSSAMLCARAAGSRPPSPDKALRSLEDPERAGPGAAGIGQARNSIPWPKARSGAPKAAARCDPGAESLAGSVAGPMARSSSGGSSPVARPAHARRGVAG